MKICITVRFSSASQDRKLVERLCAAVRAAGMAFGAFGANMPVVVIAKTGTEYKQIFNGIAAKVIFYDEHEDITAPLQKLLAGL